MSHGEGQAYRSNEEIIAFSDDNIASIDGHHPNLNKPCTKCKKEIPKASKYCLECGEKQHLAMKPHVVMNQQIIDIKGELDPICSIIECDKESTAQCRGCKKSLCRTHSNIFQEWIVYEVYCDNCIQKERDRTCIKIILGILTFIVIVLLIIFLT